MEKANLVNQIIDELKKRYKGKAVIGKKENNENYEVEGLDKDKQLPIIDLKGLRLTNISELLKNLDKTRVLIGWGKADELIQIAGISIGIPQIQNFISSMVSAGKNGFICKDADELIQGLDEYLSNLTTWNNAVVYNVDMMNKYSEENIMKRWQKLLGDK